MNHYEYDWSAHHILVYVLLVIQKLPFINVGMFQHTILNGFMKLVVN